MINLATPEAITRVFEGIDSCLQSPECSEVNYRSSHQGVLTAVLDGVDACLQSPECTQVRA